MTIDELRSDAIFREQWSACGPYVLAYLTRKLVAVAGAGADSSTCQTVSKILTDLESISGEKRALPKGPTLKPLHSMQPKTTHTHQPE